MKVNFRVGDVVDLYVIGVGWIPYGWITLVEKRGYLTVYRITTFFDRPDADNRYYRYRENELRFSVNPPID